MVFRLVTTIGLLLGFLTPNFALAAGFYDASGRWRDNVICHVWNDQGECTNYSYIESGRRYGDWYYGSRYDDRFGNYDYRYDNRSYDPYHRYNYNYNYNYGSPRSTRVVRNSRTRYYEDDYRYRSGCSRRSSRYCDCY